MRSFWNYIKLYSSPFTWLDSSKSIERCQLQLSKKYTWVWKRCLSSKSSWWVEWLRYPDSDTDWELAISDWMRLCELIHLQIHIYRSVVSANSRKILLWMSLKTILLLGMAKGSSIAMFLPHWICLFSTKHVHTQNLSKYWWDWKPWLLFYSSEW